MISVIVPYWNSEKWIGRCCESLITQQGNFEFILVNDNSTDKGREIVCEYANKDSRFAHIHNMHKKGVSGARNTGIDYAKGEWITFLDADDELLPNAYRTFIDATIEDERANIHQFNHFRCYPSIGKITMKFANNAGVYRFNTLPNVWWGVWNKLFKAEFLKDMRFDESLQYGEDAIFSMKCLCKDDYIHHCDMEHITVKHNFDNKESLSHIKTWQDIYALIRKYEEVFVKETDPIKKAEIAGVISSEWGNAMVRRVRNA